MIVRESEKEVLTVNNFEKLTKGPDALGAFLRTLPVLEGPWDAEFHARFCAGCAAENCDACPHEEFRNNPGWWLTLTDTPEPSEETKRAAKRIAALVDQHSAAEAAELLGISMKVLEILKEEKIPDFGGVTAISIAQAIGIHERG